LFMTHRTSRSTTRRAVLRGAGAAALGGAALSLTAAPAGAQGQNEAGLTGSWLVTNGVPGSTPNATLVTFIPGGAFIRAGTAHLSETPGHGAWRRVGDSDYEITYYTIRFDATGAFNGHRKTFLLATVDPTGMTFNARTRTVTIEADGTETLGAEGSNRGVRMVAEPFPTA
jgi:hypothetical protein